ncbi:gliding motility-associated C-terminal domain-containing protein [Psychroflexus sp. CAK8W]|uniref:Gliding motility-associated C-terminal domain-containing protein n=1 Tax=Psychroflexus longus TaxID=2873596 RepID=A0ABS7XL14_9FLAO|nr:PKD-like domain-containing protein [Psychroflexus longus]MBZ9779089.1 gliding motility-associated C-terminal domain-containing protein [Psychroflexus longus]
MKTKLLSTFLIGCSLLVGIAVYNFSDSNSISDTEMASANTELRKGKSEKREDVPKSFFEIFTDQPKSAFAPPELDITNTLGGFSGYGVDFQNGTKTFLRCTNVGSGNFKFEDPNEGSYPAGTTFLLEWGDGTSSSQVEDHSYTNGLYSIKYTVTLPGSNPETSIFRVFVGDTPPSVSVKLSGNNHCLPNKYDYSIEITDNQPGNRYTININDGSAPIVIDSDTLAIGADITLPYTHTFSSTSCGVSSTVNNSPTPNSFSITVRATNPCDTSGNFNSVGPIRVSEPTKADFIVPAPIACVNSLVNFTDDSFGGENTSESECNSKYGKYWEISPVGGTTIANGNIGDDNGNPIDWTDWNQGSDVLGVIFDTPGVYEVTLVTRNVCGESRITKDICIIPEVISEFTVSEDEACFEDNQIVSTTNTSQADGCGITPKYEWKVERENSDCPPSGSPITPTWEFANGTGPEDFEPEFQFNAPGIYTIRLEVFVESILPGENCRDDVFERVITIKDKPKAELADLVVCQDEPFTIDPIVYDCYTSVGTTYSWDFGASPPASIANSTDPNPSISYNTPGNYTYDLTVTNECGSNTYTGNIEVLPPVDVQADGPAEVCVDEEIVLDGTISGGTGLGDWTASVTGGTFATDASGLNPTYTPPAGYVGTITFTLTSDNSGTLCSEASDTHTVTVNSGPEVDAGNYDPICVDSTISLNGSFGGAASSITWTSSDGGTFDDPTDPSTDFTPPAGFTGIITLTITSDDPAGSCPATTDTVEIEVLPLGEVEPIPDLEVCNTEEISEIGFSSPNTANTTDFEWEIDTNIGLTPLSGTGSLPSFTAENLTEDPIIATVTVTPFVKSGSTSCEGVSETFTITVNPAPIILDTSIDLCNGDVFDYTPTSGGGNFVPTGTTYTWEVSSITPAGSITGSSDEINEQTSISQPIENSTTNAASIEYTVTPILGGCEGNPFKVTVNFDDMPVVQDINLEVCSDESLSIVPDESFSGNQIPPGTTYKWDLPVVNPAGSITGSTAESLPTTSIDQQLTNITSETATVTYTVTPDLNGCEGEPFLVNVEVKPEPFIENINLNICSDEDFIVDPEDILPNRVPAGTQYTWGTPTVSIPGTITGITEGTTPQSEISQTLVSNSSEEVVVTYEVTPENDGCFGEPFFIEVIVEPKPFIEPITESICTGGTFSIIPSDTGNNIVPVNTTYTWTEPVSVPAGAITGGAAETSAQTEISQNVTNTSENIATLTYTVTPRSGSCVGDPFTVEVIVESSGLIQEEPQSFQTICEGGQISPLGVSLESGESTSTTYQWFRNTTPTNAGGTEIPGATDATYLPPAFDIPGTYFFYVVVSPEGDQCGDVISQVSEVEVLEDPVIDVQPLDNQELCLNAPASELNVEVSGGVGPFNYQWYVNTTADTTTGTEITDETNSSFTPPTDQEGILFYYVVISQEAAGCETISIPARIRVEPQPVINQQPQSEELCLNAIPNLLSVNLNFSLGTPTYQWFENDESSNIGGTAIAGANQPTFLPPTDVAGEQFYYAVVSFDNSSCGPVVSDPATLIVVPFAEINPIEDIEVCRGDEIGGINFSTTAPTMITSYEWTNSNPEIGLAANGTGNIPVFTATNTTGVTQTAVITVTSESSFSGDPCGQSTTQFTISVPSEVIDNAVISNFNGNQTSCFDANDGSIQISPSGGTPISANQSYRYNWTGPNGFSSNQEDIFNLRQGTYDLEITDGFGCVYNFSYEIEAPEELIVTEDAVLNIQCHGEFTGKILISLTGGTGNYSYSWLKDGMLVATTQDLENIGAGYYTVIATDQNNCTVVKDFEVTEPAPIEIEVHEKSAIVCTDEISIPKNETSKTVGDEFNGFINISVEGGTPLQTGPNEFTYQYEWKNAVNQVISTEKNLTGVGPGSYSVDVYDNLTCIASKDVELIMPDPIKIEVSSRDETCAFSEDGQISLDIEGGTAPYNVEWNNGASGKELSQLQPGSYTANITDKYNCEISIDVEIEGVDALVGDYTSDNISCFNASDGFISVDVEGGRKFANGSYNYQWSGPDGFTSSEPVLNNLDKGVYSLNVTDASGCSINLVQEITEPEVLDVNYNTTLANCFGIDDGTITLFVEGGTPPYSSNFGSVGSDDSTFLFDGLSPGSYDIEVMDDNGCMQVLKIEIEQDFINNIAPPTGDAYQEFCIEDQPTVSDLSVSGMDIKWYLSPSDTAALPEDYLITASTTLYARNFDASLSCLSSDFLRVDVNIIEGIIDVNNFITVNGNSFNEKLNVVNIDLFPNNEMKIYNRYGKLVWETTGYNNTDNSFKGASNVEGTISQGNFLPTGTYFYILNYESPCRNDTKKGFVQIDNNNR